MTTRLAVYAGRFNPPTRLHRAIAERLREQFDEVIVVPADDDGVDPVALATMADLGFAGLDRVHVELSLLEAGLPADARHLEALASGRGEAWHVMEAGSLEDGRSPEQRCAVLVAEGAEAPSAGWPPGHEVVRVPADRTPAGEVLRERVYHKDSIAGFLVPGVAGHIERYGLYRPTPPSRSTPFRLDEPRLLLVVDDRNREATELADKFRRQAVESAEAEPNCVLVVGGDGTMLHAIRRYWRLRLPFLGVNAGHRGFLANGADDLKQGRIPEDWLIVRQSPLLYVESLGMGAHQDDWVSALAFNDAWVERATSQAAWMQVKVNGEVRIERLVADGILLATAAGSTAYARAMGATPLLVETPALVLVGSNVMEPTKWKSALLSLDSVVEFRTLDPEKRPLEGFADGVPVGRLRRMRVRVSRTAAAELAFCPGHDMAEKIGEIQFPPIRED